MHDIADAGLFMDDPLTSVERHSPTELVAFLEAMVPTLEASDRSIGIHYEDPGAAPITRVELPDPDPALEADIAAAFVASGLPGELVTVSGNASR